jgi:hypothetical protein
VYLIVFFTMTAQQWLTDTDINNWLERHCTTTTSCSLIGHSDTFFLTTIELHHARGQLERLHKHRQRILNATRWIIPVNLGNYHWILFIVMCKRKLICVYDSSASIDDTVLRKLDLLRELLGGLWDHCYIPYAVPQRDSYNCGVFVCTLAYIATHCHIDLDPIIYNPHLYNVEVCRQIITQYSETHSEWIFSYCDWSETKDVVMTNTRNIHITSRSDRIQRYKQLLRVKRGVNQNSWKESYLHAIVRDVPMGMCRALESVCKHLVRSLGLYQHQSITLVGDTADRTLLLQALFIQSLINAGCTNIKYKHAESVVMLFSDRLSLSTLEDSVVDDLIESDAICYMLRHLFHGFVTVTTTTTEGVTTVIILTDKHTTTTTEDIVVYVNKESERCIDVQVQQPARVASQTTTPPPMSLYYYPAHLALSQKLLHNAAVIVDRELFYFDEDGQLTSRLAI